MASEVEICNLALSRIRSAGIGSLNEPSLQAQTCALQYPILRDMLLTSFGWNFSQAVKPLALREDIDVFNWLYAYQYPSDCLYVDRLILNFEQFNGVAADTWVGGRYYDLNKIDLRQQVPYEVITVDGVKIIMCNEPSVRIQYRKRVTDTTMFDAIFVQALSWLLASEVAIPIVGGEGGRQLRMDALQLYQLYLSSAMTNDKNEQFISQPESDFISVRR